jgi:hypothetical protein
LKPTARFHAYLPGRRSEIPLVMELRAQLAEMRSQRDAWHGIAERLALSAPKSPEPEPKPAEARRSWWSRLRMTG